MAKYSSYCTSCKKKIDIKIDAINTQDFAIDISSTCPNISLVSKNIKHIDPMKEAIASDSELKSVVQSLCSNPECSVYDSIKQAIEQHLGWYYEVGI